MPETRASEIEALKTELEQLRVMVVAREGNKYAIPDPIKNMSEFSGNKKELASWLKEVNELYEMFKIKGENGQPDSLSSVYLRAIKNKVKGEARAILCANGDPDTIFGIKTVLIEQYGDQKDFATNLSAMFNVKKGDKNHLRFFNEVKELNTKLKANLSSNPLTVREIVDVITITRYLDNIGEPLASIIRQSKPRTLEEAYQSVCTNQNAESRTKPAKQIFKQHSYPSSSGAGGYNHTNNNNNSSYRTHSKETNAKPTFKRPMQQFKPRVEHNTNEVGVNSDDDGDDDYDDATECEVQNTREVNFHREQEDETIT